MTEHDIETGTPHLLAELADGVLKLTLNRPAARHALTVEMLEALSTQLSRAELAEDVRCIANGPSVASRYMKENLIRAMSGEVNDCLDIEAIHHVHCMFTADHREAASAFVENREPVFAGT